MALYSISTRQSDSLGHCGAVPSPRGGVALDGGNYNVPPPSSGDALNSMQDISEPGTLFPVSGARCLVLAYAILCSGQGCNIGTRQCGIKKYDEGTDLTAHIRPQRSVPPGDAIRIAHP